MKSLTVDKKFIMICELLLPLVFPKNWNYEANIQEFTRRFIGELVEDYMICNTIERAIVRLPIADIHILLQNYDMFKTYVLETE